jgi:hypothetical protein
MARHDVRAALEKLRGGIGFGQYVNTLESSKADVIALLLSRNTPPDKWADLIAEARVYDDILSDIHKFATR